LTCHVIPCTLRLAQASREALRDSRESERSIMSSLPAGTYEVSSIGFVDAGNETTSMKFYMAPVTAANQVAQEGLFQDVVTAAEALALGVKYRTQHNTKITFVRTVPTNGAAREVALQMIMQDATTGETYNTNLGTVDLSLIEYVVNVGAKDAVLLTTTEVAALKSALEAAAVNPRAPTHLMGVIGAKVVRGLK